MRFPQQYVQQGAFPSGSLPISGAAPQTVAGVQFDGGLVSGRLAALIAASLTTSGLTLYAEWQVLVAGVWVGVTPPPLNAPPAPYALPVFATGTGTLATTSVLIPAPHALAAGNRWIRCVVISGAESGGGTGVDSVTIAYDFRAATDALAS